MSTPETNLHRLLQSMAPELIDGVFVFVTVPTGQSLPPTLFPMMTFQEREGMTLIVREEDARAAGLVGAFRCRMITLNVHSSLDAIGFLAAVTKVLADAGISANTVSAFHHDHLFVPVDRADDATHTLANFARIVAR